MKELFNEYKKMIQEFLQNKKFVIVMIIIMILSYGFMLLNFTVGIDDLTLDKYVSGSYLLSAGRWGTWLTYNILQVRTFTPFWLEFIVILVLFFSAVSLCALLKKVSNSKLKESSYLIFATSFISFPIISNFIVYQPTNLTVALGNLFMLFALAIIYDNFFKEKKKIINILLGLFLAFPISMYESCCQTFVVLVFIVSYIYNRYNENFKFKKIFKFYFTCFITLLIGIIFNVIINKGVYFILDNLGVLQDNFAGKKNITELITEPDLIEKVYISKIGNLFASRSLHIDEFLIMGAIGFMFVIVDSARCKKEENLYLYILIILSNFILLTFMLANLYRVCYSWAITIGFIFVLINEFFKNTKKIVSVILFFVILQQTRYMNQLFYNEYVNYRRDVLYTSNIISKLQETCSDLKKPLYFVNDEEDIKKSDLYLSDDNGLEFYSWAVDSFYGDQYEAVKFFNALGYDFKVVSNVDEAEDIYNKLDDETKEKDIIELDDFIVVKVQ